MDRTKVIIEIILKYCYYSFQNILNGKLSSAAQLLLVLKSLIYIIYIEGDPLTWKSLQGEKNVH